jgi:predicted permease
MFQDLRYGIRILMKNPGFTLVAVVTLALGIGANTLIFSVVRAVLLRPLPYKDSSRIMQVWHVPPAGSFPGINFFNVSPANYLDWQRESSSFECMAAYGFRSFASSGWEQPEAINGAAVATDFFSVLRARPMLGRTFTPDEDRPGAGTVILLSNGFWRDHFAGDPAIVGRDIALNSRRYRVVGVMPRGFRFSSWAEVWTPLAWSDEERAVRGIHNYSVIARLKPGIDLRRAQAELSTVSARLADQYPADDKGWRATIVPLREWLVSDIRPALLALFVAVGFILLIACANVANLVLAKTLARQREIAIRTALGATRFTILRHIVAETVLLSVTGGIFGSFLAGVGLDLLKQVLRDRLPSFAEVSLDTHVWAFALSLSILAGVFAGLIPSLSFTRGDVNEALQQGQSRASSQALGNKTRDFLVISEIALSLLLLIGAGLTLRSLWNLQKVVLGFDPSQVLTMKIAMPMTEFISPGRESRFFQEVLERVRTLPGVEAAGAIDSLPLSGAGSHEPFSIEGRPALPMSDQPEVDVRVITPGYIRDMHIPVLKGRDLTEGDAAGRAGAVLISESLARRFWPGKDPLGKRLTLTFYPGFVREVVGIVGDVKLDSLDETRPVATIYFPLAQVTFLSGEAWTPLIMSLTVRTRSDPAHFISAVTGAIHQVGPNLPVVDVKGMNEIVSQSVSPQRFNLLLFGAFAGIALILAAIGIYGVLSYTTRRRVREIGIRMALGAGRSDALKLVVGQGFRLALIGVGMGVVGALVLARFLASLLYGVEPADPLTFGAVSLLLTAVALFASYFPARRATYVDPMVALRYE